MSKQNKNKNGNYKKGKSGNYTNPSNYTADVNREDRRKTSDKSRNKNLHSAPAMVAQRGFHEPDRSHNDPEWFKDARGLVDDAARYGSYQPTGRTWLWGGYNKTHDEDWIYGVPSALICEYVPCPGISETSTSAMSIAAQQIYQHVRRSLNKVLTGYQFADVVIAYTAFMSLVIQAREMIRDYRIANSWSSDNFSYPYGILAALGYNRNAARDLINNMANYRQRFNTLMYQASSIFLPFETNHLLKYKWMSSGLWGDKDNPKAQVYGYVAKGYYRFVETDDPDDPGSKCEFMLFDHEEKQTRNNLFAVKLNNFENCVTLLRNSDSFNSMMSDLRTAYSDVNGYVFDSLNEDESIDIDYNDVMLRQFQNIRTLPPVDLSAGLYQTNFKNAFLISQDVALNTVLCHPHKIRAEWSDTLGTIQQSFFEIMEDKYLTKNMLFNWSSAAPDNNEVIESLNGAVLFDFDSGDVALELDEGYMSCYVPIRFIMTTPSRGGTFNTTPFTSYFVRRTGEYGDLDDLISDISMFDWFPIIMDITVTPNNEGTDIVEVHYSPLVEDDVLAPVTKAQFTKINKAEQYALWGIAQTGNIG